VIEVQNAVDLAGKGISTGMCLWRKHPALPHPLHAKVRTCLYDKGLAQGPSWS